MATRTIELPVNTVVDVSAVITLGTNSWNFQNIGGGSVVVISKGGAAPAFGAEGFKYYSNDHWTHKQAASEKLYMYAEAYASIVVYDQVVT